MIFCGRCGTRNGWPMSSMRTSRAPCDVCGSFDQMNVKGRGGTTKKDLPNYTYPSNLLPSVVEQTEDEDVA